MKVDVFTIFPEMIDHYSSLSLLGRAQKANYLEINSHNFRNFAQGKHLSVDDTPFGGGAGMILKPEPIFAAVESVKPIKPLIYLSPSGRRFDQELASELSNSEGFSLLCGRYEGVDQRVRDELIDYELSIGDFVLAGGELAALVLIESVARLLPEILGNPESLEEESFVSNLLEYPQYTRPSEFRSMNVPNILLSGDHKQVKRWRKAASLAQTARLRPDLIEKRGGLSDADKDLIVEFGFEIPQ